MWFLMLFKCVIDYGIPSCLIGNLGIIWQAECRIGSISKRTLLKSLWKWAVSSFPPMICCRSLLIFYVKYLIILLVIIAIDLTVRLIFRIWAEHKYALLSYLEMVNKGVRGLILDSSGKTVPNATIAVEQGGVFFSFHNVSLWTSFGCGRGLMIQLMTLSLPFDWLSVIRLSVTFLFYL